MPNEVLQRLVDGQGGLLGAGQATGVPEDLRLHVAPLGVQSPGTLQAEEQEQLSPPEQEPRVVSAERLELRVGQSLEHGWRLGPGPVVPHCLPESDAQFYDPPAFRLRSATWDATRATAATEASRISPFNRRPSATHPRTSETMSRGTYTVRVFPATLDVRQLPTCFWPF